MNRNRHQETTEITELILDAAAKARAEIGVVSKQAAIGLSVEWPIDCTIGPGLEGAIASESKVGYVNGSAGLLSYRGYDIFELCAYSTYEEVSYLLLHGHLPNAEELEAYEQKLVNYRHMNQTLRLLMSFPVEKMNAMAALRMGTIFMRQEFTILDQEEAKPGLDDAISADEDSIAMETKPSGERRAIYEFKQKKQRKKKSKKSNRDDASGLEACYHLIAGVPTITAAITRLRQGMMPYEPLNELSHAGNIFYMMNGRRPTPIEERVLDVALILHADHGMNASTFASMVVASTMSDIYFSVGSGIAALNGPLHGGANERVLHTMREVGSPENAKKWVKESLAKNEKIPGFGHRVYKTYDPRARILGPLAKFHCSGCASDIQNLINTAEKVEDEVISSLAQEKKIFPNVDYYSGVIYTRLGIDPAMFTPLFAVSRVAGWTARVLEYIQKNRIFRPRALYTGTFNREFTPIDKR
ncbi:MAG: citrate/2-methylcitrate synthase [Deltaproteobacteria bacterium]|nr:MAG: citrate/2-methylcitrate synthase [Deltaproteobacteria bacterium]